MPKRASKKLPRDLNQRAAAIVRRATGQEEPEEEAPERPEKNPAAVALGKLGGKKGGLARAKNLSKKRRKEIAEKAARARWRKKP